MRFLTFVLALLLAGFYLVWPAYTGYQIKRALDERDAGTLSSKIDFPSVRASLRPAVTAKVEAQLASTLKAAGGTGGAIPDELKAKYMPGIVDTVLESLVTPNMLIRLSHEGRSVKETIDRIATEEASKAAGLGALVKSLGKGGEAGTALDGLGKIADQFGIDAGKVFGGGESSSQPAETPASETAKEALAKKSLGFANIKKFGFNGPLAMVLGIAKDPTAAEPDITAEMAFVDGAWKITGLVPKVE